MNELILLFGGLSGERRVSVASAQNIASATPTCTCWFWTRDNRVFRVSREELLRHQNVFQSEFLPTQYDDLGPLEVAIKTVLPHQVLFLAVHGGDGENGCLQELLEKSEIAFTGSDSRASHRAFDKTIAKEFVFNQGGKVPRGIMARGDHYADARIRIEELMGLVGSVVVKPVADGSSIGVHFVSNTTELSVALQELQRFPQVPYLVEERVYGRELTVGVLETADGPRALPCSEVKLNVGRQFDYAGKYLGDGVLEITPADLESDEASQAQELACKAHTALDCSGYSRTDVMLTRSGVVFIETNTLPGLSSASFIPQQLDAAQIALTDFVQLQAKLALQKRNESGA